MPSTEYEENSNISQSMSNQKKSEFKEDQRKDFYANNKRLTAKSKKEAFILYTIDGYSRKEISPNPRNKLKCSWKTHKRATIKVEEELEKRGF